MKISVLSENIPLSEEYNFEHGLSIFIETGNKKILFDMGASNIFYKNAIKMGISIEDVDFAIVSHGHYDHGGGLKKFTEINKVAKVFLQKGAFNNHISYRNDGSKKDIGLDKGGRDNPLFVFVDTCFKISSNIELFSNVPIFEPLFETNNNLYTEINGVEKRDNFSHELNLVIKEKGKTILFIGCGHRGISNIIRHFRQVYGRNPDYVLGGFHLSTQSTGKIMGDDYLNKLSKELIGTKSIFYTCHCTGIKPFNYLKQNMSDRIFYLKSGSKIEI